VEQLELTADQAIAACGGDAREAVKALLIASEFLERAREAKVWRGYIPWSQARTAQFVFGITETWGTT
jgi:hypothetical protein